MTQPTASLPSPLARSPLSDAERQTRIAELAQLVESDRARYVGAAWRVLRDPTEAEDAVQDALASACRKVEAFRDESQLSTWLYRIVINASLMRLRSRRRKPATDLDAISESHLTQDRGHGDAVERRELAGILLRCAESLSGSQRELLLSRYVDETPLRELARELEISEGGVKARLHRARAALRTAFFAALGPEPA